MGCLQIFQMQLLSPSGSVINPGANINQAVVIANPNKVVGHIVRCSYYS